VTEEGDLEEQVLEKLEDKPLPRSVAYAFLVAIILIIAAYSVAILLEDGSDDVERSTWAYEMVQLDLLRGQGLTGEGVRVGILDTGLDPTHPILEGVRVVAWTDLVKGKGSPYDNEGHGTAMAGIIAGRAPLRGGALGVDLIIAKVIDKNHALTDDVIADGIDFCLDPNGDGDYEDGADIISLSLGGRFDELQVLIGTKTQNAIAQAVANGVVIVAAAGNDGGDDVMMPGRIKEVISVGALDANGQLAPFSTMGNASIERPDPHKKPEVVAPGVDIVTAHPGDSYARGSGTSHATAFTTAVLAAALSGHPDLLHNGDMGGNQSAVETVKDALMVSSQALEWQQLPHDPGAGYGLVQADDLHEELGTR
jgi:subtilisin family serine protease